MDDPRRWLDAIPPLEGALSLDEAALNWAAEDFGHIVYHRPAAVLQPASPADIAVIVCFAQARGLPIAARGQGHGTFGHAQAAGGIVVDMSALSFIHSVEPGSVVVDAGARWSEVLAATLPLGLTPPVLTDYLQLSVGGTLSVGGLGGASHRHGAQTDCVTALEVVTPGGEIRTCSRTQHNSLFDAVRAGRGRKGIITKATLALIPAPEMVRRYKLPCPAPESLVANQLRLLGRGALDYLEGQVRPEEDAAGWRYVLEAAAYYTPPKHPDDRALLDGIDWISGEEEIEDVSYESFLKRMAPGEDYLRATGAWFHPHPWCNLLLPAEHALTVFADTMRTLAHADLGEDGLALIYPIPTSRFCTPRLARPSGRLAFLFALLRSAHPRDPAALRRMQEDNRRLTRRALDLGAATYLA